MIVLVLAAAGAQAGPHPNPPIFPPSVSVFDPNMDADTINAVTSAVYAINGCNKTTCQFSQERFAFLFKPGDYEGVEVPVGYYTSVYGTGRSPGETRFVGGGASSQPSLGPASSQASRSTAKKRVSITSRARSTPSGEALRTSTLTPTMRGGKAHPAECCGPSRRPPRCDGSRSTTT